MKNFLIILLLSFVGIACNNNSDQNETIGDSLIRDPQTGQPITTNPDTVGPDSRDTLSTN